MATKTNPDTEKNVVNARYKTIRPVGSFQGEEIILARHAETIAEVFPDWIERCKLDDAFYQPFDLNVPVRIPRRTNMAQAYQHDPPLSEVGRIMAQLFARELVSRNAIPKVIYASPSLASLQTSADIQNYIGKECGRICIDASLSSNRSGAPYWLTGKEIAQMKFKVDEKYTPEKTDVKENDLPHAFESMKKFMQKLSKRKGIILVVTDSAAVKMLRDAVSGVEAGYSSEQELREAATQTYPPMSSTVLVSRSSQGHVRILPSRVCMRPLTTIGECTRPDFDIECNCKAK